MYRRLMLWIPLVLLLVACGAPAAGKPAPQASDGDQLPLVTVYKSPT